MTIGYSEPQVDEGTVEPHATVNSVLHGLLRYEEILGALAVSVDGLVIGSAGVDEEDADFLSVLGSSLVGVAERSTRRIGAGSALSMSILANDGMVTVRNAGSFALTLLTERADGSRVVEVSQTALTEIAAILNPI